MAVLLQVQALQSWKVIGLKQVSRITKGRQEKLRISLSNVHRRPKPGRMWNVHSDTLGKWRASPGLLLEAIRRLARKAISLHSMDHQARSKSP